MLACVETTDRCSKCAGSGLYLRCQGKGVAIRLALAVIVGLAESVACVGGGAGLATANK